MYIVFDRNIIKNLKEKILMAYQQKVTGTYYSYMHLLPIAAKPSIFSYDKDITVSVIMSGIMVDSLLFLNLY